MNAVATIHYPDLNPVGPASILATLIVLVLVSLSSGWVVRLPVTPRRLVVSAVPWLFLLLLHFTEGSLLYLARCFPDADDHVAEVIYLVFGFAFALEAFRFRRLPYRLNATVMTLVFGSALVFRAAAMPIRWYNDLWIAYAAVASFWFVWLPIVLWINRRMRLRLLKEKGLCVKCDYDLTGNVSGICPECGTPIEKPEPQP